MHINKLDDIVNKYQNGYHRTIKMKLDDVNWSTYIDFNKKDNKGDPKFKVSNHVRIPNYKNISAKRCIPNWSKVVLKIPFRGLMLLVILKVILNVLRKTITKKTSQSGFRVEKLIKKRVISYISDRKVMIIHSWIVGLIKNIIV